jgi:hypothetical protein
VPAGQQAAVGDSTAGFSTNSDWAAFPSPACKWCRRYGKQIRFLRDAAHDYLDELTEAAPRRLSPEARERLKRSLNSERE